MEWANNVTQYAIYTSSDSILKHDPERLPTIDIRHGNKRRRYKNGKLYNLKRYVSLNFSSHKLYGQRDLSREHHAR